MKLETDTRTIKNVNIRNTSWETQERSFHALNFPFLRLKAINIAISPSGERRKQLESICPFDRRFIFGGIAVCASFLENVLISVVPLSLTSGCSFWEESRESGKTHPSPEHLVSFIARDANQRDANVWYLLRIEKDSNETFQIRRSIIHPILGSRVCIPISLRGRANSLTWCIILTLHSCSVKTCLRPCKYAEKKPSYCVRYVWGSLFSDTWCNGKSG